MARNVFHRDFSMLKAGVLSIAMAAALVLHVTAPAAYKAGMNEDSPRYVLVRATLWMDGDCIKERAASVDL